MTCRIYLTLSALCLLVGSTWLVDAALPAALPGALSLLVDNTVLALAFFFLSPQNTRKATPQILCYSTLLMAVPGALASLADGRLSSTTMVLVYTLVPAATVFFAAQSSPEDLLNLLGPALAAVAGAALILSFALPGSTAGIFWLAALVLSAVASGFATLRLHSAIAETPILPIAAQAAMACAIVALPLYLHRHPTLVLLTWPQALLAQVVHLAFEAGVLVLTVLLLRELRPIAFSTRFLLIPLVTIVEGYAILHPTTTWTLPVGALLLAGGSALLIRHEHQR